MNTDLDQQLHAWANQARQVGNPPPVKPPSRESRNVRAWIAAGVASTAATAALIIWAGTGGGLDAGVATVVPAATPTTSAPAPDLAAFERSGSYGPLLPGERRWAPNVRVIPATGVAPAISAEAAKSAAYPHRTGSQSRMENPSLLYAQLSYMTDDGATGVGPDGKLPKDPHYRIIVNRLVWLIVEPNAPTRFQAAQSREVQPFFTAVDARTGKALIGWQSQKAEERGVGAPPD